MPEFISPNIKPRQPQATDALDHLAQLLADVLGFQQKPLTRQTLLALQDVMKARRREFIAAGYDHGPFGQAFAQAYSTLYDKTTHAMMGLRHLAEQHAARNNRFGLSAEDRERLLSTPSPFDPAEETARMMAFAAQCLNEILAQIGGEHG